MLNHMISKRMGKDEKTDFHRIRFLCYTKYDILWKAQNYYVKRRFALFTLVFWMNYLYNKEWLSIF